jgi:hypothetical protein
MSNRVLAGKVNYINCNGDILIEKAAKVETDIFGIIKQ